MKIAILMDKLSNKGGIERIVLLQAKELNADIYTGKIERETTFEGFKDLNIIEINKTNLPQRVWSIYNRLKFKNLKLKDYDLVISHSGASLGVRHKNLLWFCCSPTIWLYSTTDEDLKDLSKLKRNLIKSLFPIIKFIDKSNVKNAKNIITISENVKQRVKEIYNRDSTLIYPPVNLKDFKFIESGDFYLSPARLTPYKRVDVIVKAFQKMPDKKLIVSGGGSDLEKIKELAEGYKNIEVLGWVSDKKLSDLYGKCKCVIASSYFEDFGMIATEGMSAGKPVIAPNDKGFAESIIQDKTGYLIDPTEENIINAVKKIDKRDTLAMREDCEERAKFFSEDKFLEKLKGVIKDE